MTVPTTPTVFPLDAAHWRQNVSVTTSEHQMPNAASSWSAPTSTSEVHRRAGGRRKYNSVRRFKADLRRIEVEKLFAEYAFARGAQARIARELGVNRSTVSRDIRRLWAPEGEVCSKCERMMSYKEWAQLEADRSPRLSDLVAPSPSRCPTSLAPASCSLKARL